ncbi:uncharacterized protein LOC115748148 [Rhodamnia argentea]|uniref:Uncharacterized protein LOC115748148 n=1 Tax=Rhodamnia argentea TaxID=178133 RepID=A0ABM3HV87_9MYRT|nr:uncharacterized protein LOC115748148 [Rhodamnia argentea]
MGLSSVSASKAKVSLRRYSRRIMRSKKFQRYRFFMVLLLVVILWQRSNAALGSWKGSFRKPAGGVSSKVAGYVLPAGQASQDESDKQRSEMAWLVLNSSGGEIAAGENCSAAPLSGTCQVKNLTACVRQHGAGNGTNETFLFIWNAGETPLKMNVTFLPANITPGEIQVAKQEKINITAYVGGNSSIVLDGGEGHCVMDMAFLLPFAPSITSGSDNRSSQVGSTPDTPSASNVPGVVAAGKCLLPSKSCQVKNLTACLHYNRNATMETLLLVQNGGEIPLRVNITLLPANITLDKVELPDQQWKMVNVTDKFGANSSILLTAADWDCVVELVSESNSPKQFSSHVSVVLFLSGIVILASATAYWKLRAAVRRVDGTPYEQLEMGMGSADSIRGRTFKTAGEGWDQSWGDDEWEEVKAVKSPSSVQKGNLIVNGIKDD